MAEKRIVEACDEGWQIYCDWLKRNRDDETFKSLDYQAKYEYYFKRYADYARQYPIILRYIACFGMFHRKAVEKYLKKCTTVGASTDEEFCERQADYVKYLWLCSNKHIDGKKLKIIWQQTKDALLSELTTRKKELQEIKDMREKNKISNNITRIENVRQRIARLASERANS